MPRLEDLELQIKQTSASTSGIKNITDALGRLASSARAANASAKAIKSLGDSMKSASSTGTANLEKSLNGVGNAATVSADKLARMKSVLSSIGASVSSGGVKSATASLKELSRIMTESTPEQAQKAIKKLFDALESGNSETITESIKGLKEVIGNLPPEAESAEKSVKKFQGALRNGGSHITQFAKKIASIPLNAFKNKVTGIFKPLSNLYNSFKRIAMYRALRTALKEITQGFAIGVKNLYAWAGLVNNSFKGTMDSLATSMNYLRNSLGAMVSPLLDALAPAVDALVDKFVDLVNLVNQFFATMTGKTTWRKALKTQKEYADNTDDAAKAQARLNHQLMAFDELNNISASNPSGRGGGGNNDDVSADDFEELELPDWAQDIKDAIDRGDWAGAGEALADKLNGIIEDWDSYSAGQLLGQKINNVLSFYVSFMDKFDWAELGKKFAGYVNGVFNSIDPQTLGQAMVAHIKAAFEFLANFIPNVDVSNIALAFSTAINELFSDENAVNVGKTIAGVINKGIEFLKTMITGGYIEKRIPGTDKVIREWVDGIDFKQAGYGIFEAIGTAIKNIKWEDLGTVIQNLAGGLVDMVSGAFDYMKEHPSDVTDAIKDFFSGLWGENGEGALKLIKATGLILGFKLAFGAVFGDAGLISTAKTAFTTLLSAAGISNVVIACAIGLVWGVSEIVDNCKKYGVDRGLWMSLSIADPEMIAKLGLDTTGFVNSFTSAWDWLVGQLGVLGPILKAMGIDLPDIPSPKPKKPEWMTQFTSGLKGISTAATSAGKKVDQLPPDDDVVSKFQTQTDKEKGYLNGDKNSLKSAAKDAHDNGVSKMGPTTSDGNNFWTKVKNNLTTHLTGDKNSFVAKADTAGTTGVKKLTPTTTDGNNFWTKLKDNFTTHLTGDKNSFVAKADAAGTTSIKRLTPDKTDGNNYWTKLKDNFTTHLTGEKSSIVASADSAGSKTVSKLTPSKTDGNNFWTSLKNNFATHLTGDKNSISSAAGTASGKVAGIGTELGKVTGSQYDLDIGYDDVTAVSKAAKTTYDYLSDSASKTWTIKAKGDFEFKAVPTPDGKDWMYASGGFPPVGSVFRAGEAGPELVGTINGRTGVVSANEISGIGDAIYDTGETEAALLQQLLAVGRQLLAKSGNVTLAPNAAAGRWVAQSQAAYARATGG